MLLSNWLLYNRAKKTVTLPKSITPILGINVQLPNDFIYEMCVYCLQM